MLEMLNHFFGNFQGQQGALLTSNQQRGALYALQVGIEVKLEAAVEAPSLQ